MEKTLQEIVIRPIKKIVLLASAISAFSPIGCSDPYARFTDPVANADTTSAIIPGGYTVSGYYHQEKVPKGSSGLHAYVDSVLSWNGMSRDDLGTIPAGKVLILPDLDGDGKAGNSK